MRGAAGGDAGQPENSGKQWVEYSVRVAATPALSRRTLAQRREKTRQIPWQRRFEFEPPIVARMTEREPVRVQRLAGKGDRAERIRTVDVAVLPHQSMAAQACLDADLVALARVQP